MKLYRNHRTVGRQIGAGTMELNGEERQVYILAPNDFKRVVFPVESLLEADMDDVARNLRSEFCNAIKDAMYLGLTEEDVRRVFERILEDIRNPTPQ